MAASYETIDKVFEIIKKHVDDDVFKAIITDLMEVKGNSSFRETINRLAKKSLKLLSDSF